MLEIINNLGLFFEDCYRRINVREYARLMKISAPTASKLLHKYQKDGFLIKEVSRNYIFFFANKENKDFVELSRMYWRHKLNEFVSLVEEKLISPTMILFGSLSKAEVNQKSDVDIAIFAKSNIKFSLTDLEKKLDRNIQIFHYSSFSEIKNKELEQSIFNGYILTGRL